jgi:hypothetical protein
VYLSFQSVVLARLIAAARGWRPDARPGEFSLGRWAVPVAGLALAYGVAMPVDLCWPRPAHQVAGWLTLLSALLVAGVGAVVLKARRLPAAP